MNREFRAQAHAVTRHETPKRLVALIAVVLGLGVVVSQPPVAPAQQHEDQSVSSESAVSPDSSSDTDPEPPTTDPEPPTTDPEPTADSAGSASSAPSGSDSTESDSTTSTETRSAQVSAAGPRAIGAQAAQSPVLLGTTESVAVLGGSAVTNTGPSVISGDVDVAPACAVSGFPPGIVINGTIHRCDAVAA
ncbi:MAG: ice-binding family protein, partial [Actinomycetota bacterium]|nr:ice-binding family protein [Actinomycetota bacterium]